MLLAVNRGFAFISCSTNQSRPLKTIVSAMGESYIWPCLRSNYDIYLYIRYSVSKALI